ncbi:MAG: DUF3971 domain-containing protein [Hyphomonadaceae bacterium]
MKVSAKILVLEILAFVTFLILAGVGFLAWRLSQGPIDLEFIRPQVEQSLAEARGGRPVKIEKLGLEWVRDRGRVEAIARGFTALDADQKVAFRADRAMIAIDAGSLFAFQVKTQQLRLEDGQATVVRSKDGVWTLADIEIAKEPEASDKPFDPVRDINWATLATPIRALISAGSFEQVELANFHLDVIDQKAGTTWGADPVDGKWKATREGVSLELDVRLTGAREGEPNKVRIALASDGEVARASGKLTFDGVDPMSVARMFGYTGDAFTSARSASATFAVTATERSGLLNTQLSLAGVAGVVKLGDEDIQVRDLSFSGSYDPATKFVTLESLNIDSDRVTGAFTGALDARAMMAGDLTLPTDFAVSSEAFTLSLPGVFEEPVKLHSLAVNGQLSPDRMHILFTNVKAGTGGMTATGSGEVWFEGEGEQFAVGVKAKASSEGTFTPQDVVAFWPAKSDAYARSWVKANIPSAVVSKAVLDMDWPPGAMAKGFLPDEHLSLTFEVEKATVKFLPDFPAATDVSGKGHLRGNSITLDVTGGVLQTWEIEEAKIVLPQFAPMGAMADITVLGRGPLMDLLRIVDDSKLDISSRYDLQIGQIAGQGGISVKVGYPMIPTLSEKDIVYSIKGGFSGVRVPDIAGDFGLGDGNVSFELTENGITMNGQGRFGPAPVSFEWREHVGGDDGQAELVARARATPDLLNAFGLAARNFMQGEADLELRASGPGGRNFDTVTATVDLEHAQVEFAEFGWRKPFEAAAKGTFRYGKDSTGAILAGDIRADGLELIAEAQLDPAGMVTGVDIERLFSRGTVDVRGRVTRREDGGYRANLNGPFFDASPWMDAMLDMSGDTVTAVGGPGDPGPVHELQLNADKLRVRSDADLSNVRIALSVDGEGPRSGSISGQISRDKYVNVAISTNEGKRNISLRSDDAGFAARVLLKADYLVGGKLTVDGSFVGPDGDATIRMTDVRLKDAPLLAQIFSLASLQGLADVLSGEGVLFTEVYAPVTIVDGRIDAPGMRASGPAMGITARGWIAPEAGELSLDGVLVPSFGVNSLLGGLPIIGDLFVSRQGEGMFAPTYSVRGTFARARVSINPVAAFTPGVLRRIFENPTEPPPAPDATLPEPTATPSPPAAPSKP